MKKNKNEDWLEKTLKLCQEAGRKYAAIEKKAREDGKEGLRILREIKENARVRRKKMKSIKVEIVKHGTTWLTEHHPEAMICPECNKDVAIFEGSEELSSVPPDEEDYAYLMSFKCTWCECLFNVWTNHE